MARTPPTHPQVLPGTLDLIVLAMLDRSACHAYELTRRISAVTGRTFIIEEGSLYPCLNRLEKRGMLTRQPSRGPTGRPIRICSLTTAGRRECREQIKLWRSVSHAVEAILGMPSPIPFGDDHSTI